jgi:hypothetical protein
MTLARRASCGTVVLALSFAILLSAAAQAQTRQVIGYAGVLGEWELVATVTEAGSPRGGELSGAATMTHVGICTQDEPERKTGEIRLQMSASRLSATLSLAGEECTYSGQLSDAYKGQMTCPGRPALPLILWVR